MKLELKFIAPYLAHGLKAKSDSTNTIRTVVLNHFTYDLNTVGLNHLIEDDGVFTDRHKPLLLPLSALTEPLEDGSIPAIRLAELLIEKGIKNDIAPTIPFTSKIVTKPFGKLLKVTKCDEWYVMISFDNPGRAQHILIEKLIEWHFDIYGLIDAGLAIDKRTIKL